MNAHITSSTSLSSRIALFAVTMTVSVAIAAWFLSAVAHLPEQAIVLSVMVTAFISSWLVTNSRPAGGRYHRVTLVPVRAGTR